MSNLINDKLLEEAYEMTEYWAGTMWERMIQRDIECLDLDALKYHVNEARKEMAIQEDGWTLDEVK